MSETVEKKPRSSNFELLRIVCMFLIVAHHYSVHSYFSFENTLSFNRILVQILSLGGKLGVNVFVLISGYFLCEQKQFRWKSILKFVIQVTVFSVVLNGVFWFIKKDIPSIQTLIKVCLPLFYDGWWFARTYFVLILLSPILNHFMNGINQNTFRKSILFCLLLWSIIPTLTTAGMESGNLLWFILLYFIAAYIRKFQSRAFSSQKAQCSILFLSTFCLVLSVLVLDILGLKFPVFAENATYLARIQSIVLVLQSISLFCVFKNWNIGKINFINVTASAMFGVYLIHDNYYVRIYFWKDILKSASYQTSPFLFLHAAISIFGVFILCTILSLLYNGTVGKIADKSLSFAARKSNAYLTAHPNFICIRLYQTGKAFLNKFF